MAVGSSSYARPARSAGHEHWFFIEQFGGYEHESETPQRVVQGKDVYEWENGVVYLISSGKSPLDSFFLDNSENGDDVFFATAQGLVPGDTDGAYDVYDARVPQPGDNPPSVAVPCKGRSVRVRPGCRARSRLPPARLSQGSAIRRLNPWSRRPRRRRRQRRRLGAESDM